MHPIISRFLSAVLPKPKAKPVEPTKPKRDWVDPLDYRARGGSWSDEDKATQTVKLATIHSFPMAELSTASSLQLRNGSAMDSAEMTKAIREGRTFAMDDNGNCGSMTGSTLGEYTVPNQIANWFMTQSFIGYQQCALLAQHWLIDKACSMSGEDAIRNGWEIKARADEAALSDEQLRKIKEYDEKFKLTEQMTQLNRFKNVFGIRVLLFIVESEDPKYYEKPFNPDGIAPGAYKGISQVDPYWMMPMLTAESTSDPANEHFYEPEYWIISGKRFHRTHLIIARGPEPADLLKPTYIFGGIPLTQRIYERVYAAERIANEAPLLATNKRTTAVHVDMEKAIANQGDFEQRILTWVKYRDNHAVKVLGQEETMEQFDTSLADFDAVIMNQYQLVAAIAKTPATKLLGTSPKGFNATGEFETVSYHEELESIQKHVYTPFLDRHYLLLSRSMGLDVEIIHVWESVDSTTVAQRADLNDKLANTDKTLIDMGVISPDEARNRIRDNKHSGYNRLQDDDANSTPGMSPDNLVKMEQASAKTETAEAEMTNAENGVAPVPAAGATNEAAIPYGKKPVSTPPTPVSTPAATVDPTESALNELKQRLLALESALTPEGFDTASSFDPHAGKRSVQPGVTSTVRGSVAGAGSVLGEMPLHKLPKVKLHGLMMDIENPRGTIRSGMDISGNTWNQKMPHHYGYIRGTKGADGEEMDCFIGPNADSRKVFVVNQNVDGVFDEHKCMIGFNTADEAKEAYRTSFSDDWKGFDSIVPMSMDQFKAWLKDGDCYSPLSAACIAQTTSTPQTDRVAMDKAEFKESEHPRAPNGQFGSGGGSAKPAAKKEGKRKGPGSKKDYLPQMAKEITAKTGKEPTPEEFHKAATEAGFEISQVQSTKYLKVFLKENKTASAGEKPQEQAAAPAKSEEKPAAKVKAEKPAEKPAEGEGTTSAGGVKYKDAKTKKNAESIQSIAAITNYKMATEEGTLNTFKDAAGNTLIANPISGAWALKNKNGVTITNGQTVDSMFEHLSYHPGKKPSAETVAIAAEASGYNKEGTYSGITYYKDGKGKKVSYKEDTDTWMVKDGQKVVASGSGAMDLQSWLYSNLGSAPQPSSAPGAGKPTSAATTTNEADTGTKSAKGYGDRMSPDKFQHASSGIANEKALPKQIQESIKAYKGAQYRTINNAMRYNESFDAAAITPQTMAHILNLQRAFQMVAPSTKEATVGRKIGVAALKSMVKDAGIGDLSNLKAGDILRDPGIVSTSHSESVWSGDVRFEIKLPKGSKAIDISETIKLHQGEQEVILGPDSKLKISEVKSGDAAGKYKYHITCELVQ